MELCFDVDVSLYNHLLYNHCNVNYYVSLIKATMVLFCKV